ncbi:hypothetical protein B9Z19DRAFT_1194501 [Tuber borchii]|uniref:ABM domain-containing protein n=1 Tax=Tuber borchii TaxID=42251 RepID=A0A2T6ZML9_TUBBO|nr:hypothetical protein B9Z19DRAFT_1194501 [Tuber borchii]
MSRVTPVTEFITFPVKDVEKAVGSENWIRDIAKCVGCTGGNWGWQIEDGGNLHWALNWTSHSAQQAFSKQSTYPTFKEKVVGMTSGAPSFFHATLTPHEPTAVFEAPITEWCKLNIAPGTDKDEWISGFNDFKETLVLASGYRGHACGWGVEDPDMFMAVIGWESVESHHKFLKEEGGNMEWVVNISDVESMEIWHVKKGGAIPPAV